MKSIYLIKSDSFNLLHNKISEITEEIEEVNKFDLDEMDIKDVIEDGSYGSLFNEKKAMLINNTKYFGGKFLYEDESELIYNFLSNLDDQTVVIFICNEITKSKAITKKVIDLGAQVIDLTTLSEEEQMTFIKSTLDKDGIRINDKDIQALLKKVANNIDLFFSEIYKISIITKNITNTEIEEYSSYNEEDLTFVFSNAVVEKKFDVVFDLLDKLLAKGSEVNGLVGLLASSYTTIYIVKDAISHGLSDEAIEQATGFKSGRIYINKKFARLYTMDELKDIILNLCIADKKIKTGSDPVHIFKEFLLNI